MRFLLVFSAVLGLVVCGCTPTEVAQSGGGSSVVTESGEAVEVTEMPASEEPEGTDPAPESTDPSPATTDPAAAETPEPAPAAEAAGLTPVAITDGVAALSADNTKIQFTGIHSPPKEPDPRVGHFAKFSGEAKVNAEAKTLESVSVEIDTASLATPIEKLTNHLQSEDFFHVREFPTAKFESTEIAAGDEGQATIKGNLTLHGVTKEISFPATVSISEAGLTLKADFDISRAEFGIGKPEGIEDKVPMSIAVGQQTPTP